MDSNNLTKQLQFISQYIIDDGEKVCIDMTKINNDNHVKALREIHKMKDFIDSLYTQVRHIRFRRLT